MYHIVRPTDHAAWLEERKKGIGSSEAGTIVGVNHFETIMKLWAKKVGLAGPTPESDAMEAGHELEPSVAHWFSSRTGAYVLPQSAGDWMAVDNDRPYLRVSPDRLFYRKGEDRTRENLCILECKTTTHRIDKDHIPDYWFWQVQYQMGVMGVKCASVAWISCSGGRFLFDWTDVPFNPNCFSELVSRIDTFWNVNVLQRVKPDAVSTVEDAQICWDRAEEGSRLVADEAQEILVQRYLDADARKKAASEEMDSIGLEIRLALRDKESLVSSTGEILATCKEAKTTRFDTTGFKAANPEEYMRWANTSSTRRLELKRKRTAEPAGA